MIHTQTTTEHLPGLVGQIASPVQPGLPFALRLPCGLLSQRDILAGRYFLARCSNAIGVERNRDWSIFLRRALFVCDRQPQDQYDCWRLYLPSGPDPGVQWLAQRLPAELLNLLGPFGNGFSLRPDTRNLLVLIDWADDPAWFWQLFSVYEQMLDRGGRVTLLLRAADEQVVARLLPLPPLQVEIRTAADETAWQAQLAQTVGWADQICAGIPARRYQQLLRTIQDARFYINENFAQVLVRADLLCGVGACLVCTVPTARGRVTRACIHGPVFDLMTLVD